MNIIFLAQSVSNSYLEIIENALPAGSKIILLTGSKISENANRKVILTTGHKPQNLKSRLSCWVEYYFDIRRIMKENQIDTDLIYAISNPPINSYIGYKLKKKLKIPFIYMNWDIYPQIIEQTFRNPIVKFCCACWHSMNQKIYPNINQMLTIGEVMKNSINDGLVKPIDIKVVPIAADVQKIKPVNKENNPFCIEHNLVDKFVVLYSGKMGQGHNIKLIIEAAEKLQGNKDIVFLLIGNGSKYDYVQRMICEKKMDNVALFPLQAEDVFLYSIASGDIGIVSQESKMSHLFMPSKTYDMMAAGLAIIGICSENDDLKRLIDLHNIGDTITDDRSSALVSSIEHYYKNKAELDNCKKNSREIAMSFYEKELVTKIYEDLFGEHVPS